MSRAVYRDVFRIRYMAVEVFRHRWKRRAIPGTNRNQRRRNNLTEAIAGIVADACVGLRFNPILCYWVGIISSSRCEKLYAVLSFVYKFWTEETD